MAERSGIVARQTGQTVIGVVENMAGEVFGSGGGALAAAALGVPLLAEIPLDARVRAAGDAGTPLVIARPADAASVAIAALADELAGRSRNLAGRPLPMSVTP